VFRSNSRTSSTNSMDDEGQAQAGVGEGDTLLEELVRLADRRGLEVGVTIYIGGTLISGVLTSGQAFFEGAALRLQSARGPAHAKQALMGFFRDHRDQEMPSSGEGEGVDTEGDPFVGYVHLRNARPFDASGPYLSEGVWWRGRLDRIDGFNFGLVNPEGQGHPRPASG
jgi:hypothetical protein